MHGHHNRRAIAPVWRGWGNMVNSYSATASNLVIVLLRFFHSGFATSFIGQYECRWLVYSNQFESRRWFRAGQCGEGFPACRFTGLSSPMFPERANGKSHQKGSKRGQRWLMVHLSSILHLCINPAPPGEPSARHKQQQIENAERLQHHDEAVVKLRQRHAVGHRQ